MGKYRKPKDYKYQWTVTVIMQRDSETLPVLTYMKAETKAIAYNRVLLHSDFVNLMEEGWKPVQITVEKTLGYVCPANVDQPLVILEHEDILVGLYLDFSTLSESQAMTLKTKVENLLLPFFPDVKEGL